MRPGPIDVTRAVHRAATEPRPRHALPLSVAAFAELVGVSTRTAERMISAGQVRSVKVRGRRVIPGSEAERILAAGTGAPEGSS